MKNKEKHDFIFNEFKKDFFKRLNDFLLDDSDKSSNNFISYLSDNGVTKKEIYNILIIKNNSLSTKEKKQKIIDSLATQDWNDLSDREDSEKGLTFFDYEKDKSTLDTSFSKEQEGYDSDKEADLLGEDFYAEIQK